MPPAVDRLGRRGDGAHHVVPESHARLSPRRRGVQRVQPGRQHDDVVERAGRIAGRGKRDGDGEHELGGGGSTSGGTTSESGASAGTSAGTGTGTTSGLTDGGADASNGTPSATTTLRVHYPVGTHTLTVLRRGRPAEPGAPRTRASPRSRHGHLGRSRSRRRRPPSSGSPSSTGRPGPSGRTTTWPPARRWTSTRTSRRRRARSSPIADFHSTVLDNDRAIYAYLPASYAENTVATYPVVYMHDGQNLWAALPQLAFASTWNVDTAFDTASNTGVCSSGRRHRLGRAAARRARRRPATRTPTARRADCAHVPGGHRHRRRERGASRVYEYTPTTDPTEADAGLGAQGGADLYIQMLVTELKPQIDAMLRTRPDVGSTAMAGSSLGGLVTAYAAFKRPDIYGRVAELSPVDLVGQRRHRDRREGDPAGADAPARSSTSTRGRGRSTTRRTPTSLRRRTWRSATSRGPTSATLSSRARSTARSTGPSGSRGRCS